MLTLQTLKNLVVPKFFQNNCSINMTTPKHTYIQDLQCLPLKTRKYSLSNNFVCNNCKCIYSEAQLNHKHRKYVI